MKAHPGTLALTSLFIVLASPAAEARGHGHGGGFVFGFAILILVGLVAMFVYRALSGDPDWYKPPSEFSDWIALGLAGMMLTLVGSWFAVFGVILWLTVTGQFPVVSSIVGIAFYGFVCSFPARAMFDAIRNNRKTNRDKLLKSQGGLGN